MHFNACHKAETYLQANYYAETGISIIKQHGQLHQLWREANRSYDEPNPFFMYFAIQNVHSPYT